MAEGIFFAFIALVFLAIYLARRSDHDRYRLMRRGKYIGPPTEGSCVQETDVTLAIGKDVARELVEAAFEAGGARHISGEGWPGWVTGWTRARLGLFGFQWGVYPVRLEEGRVVIHCVARPRNSSQAYDPFGRVPRSLARLVAALTAQVDGGA